MSINIGTCGFAYPDWDGYFYAPSLPPRERLTYYSERFRAVELDSLFYRLPHADMVEKMARRTRKEFRFTVKVHRSITHEFDLSAAEFGAFRRAVAPLVNADKLGAVLAQFPPAFHCTRDAVQTIRLVREELADLPLAVEFRHASWNRPETFEFLRKHGIAYCAVDLPPLDGSMPPLAVRTADIAYVRLHGRNVNRWLNGRTASERHDYLYAEEEIEAWVQRIEAMAQGASAVYVMFGNVHQAQAITNARQLAERLGEPIVLPPRRGERALQPELALAS